MAKGSFYCSNDDHSYGALTCVPEALGPVVRMLRSHFLCEAIVDRTVCSGHCACSVLKPECKSQGPDFLVRVLSRYFTHPRSVNPLLCIKFLLFRFCNLLFYFSPFLLYLSTFKKKHGLSPGVMPGLVTLYSPSGN